MRIALGLAVFAACFATPAMAANWYVVATSASKSSAGLVDRDSIADTPENYRRASTLQIFSVDTKDGVAAMQAVQEFDCTGSRDRYVLITSFTLSGSKVGEQAGSGTWRSIEKGTVSEALLQFVCSKGAQPDDAFGMGDGLPIEAGRARLLKEKPGTYGGH